MSRPPIVPVGAKGWRVIFDTEMGGETSYWPEREISQDEYERDKCKHCGPTYHKTFRRGSPPIFDYTNAHWILPRAIQADTDDASVTIVCLDCINELAIPLID
jgi:hypothetical protein